MSNGLFSLLFLLGIFSGIQASAFRDSSKKWPNGKVPIRFHSSLSASEKNTVIEAMQEFHQKTCVRFKQADETDEDFVLLKKPTNRFSCSSMVGRQGSQQPVYLGQGCYSREVILHELMHTLGFIEEHQRADRDEYITIHWENIGIQHQTIFKKREQADLTLMNTAYAYDSVMQLGNNIWSKNGSPTMVAKNGAKLGGGQELSPIDVKRINEYYGCQETKPEGNELDTLFSK